MTNQDLSNMILGHTDEIAAAVGGGAAWEIWLQVQLNIWLGQAHIAAAREVPYPAPNQGWSLDLLAQDAGGQYAIELKVESANNAGAVVLNSALADVNKIAHYQLPAPVTRWVVAVGYSAVARNALQAYAAVPGNHAIYNAANGIGVLIVTV